MIKAAILGATGYTGLELIKILDTHPDVEIVAAAARSEAGKAFSEIFPVRSDIVLESIETVSLTGVDVVFLGLPHGAAQEYAVRGLDAGAVVIDLSADHRLSDAAAYRTWYGTDAPAAHILSQAVYGLTEWQREAVAKTQLIANPGCYPTSILLAVAPLLAAGHLHDARIIADSKSGTSGAGRSAQVAQLFAEVNENFKPYGIGHVHRHVAEIEQELVRLGGSPKLVFSPHLLPVTRGMLSTVYLPWPEGLSEDAVYELYRTRYAREPFVWLLPAGQTATLQHSINTNRCALSLHPVPSQDTLIVVSSIDNLIKGASGQAVQNMNVRFGLAETSGLLGAPTRIRA